MERGGYVQFSSDENQCQLFVGGIHPKATRSRTSVITGELTEYFSQFGPMTECRMIKDKVTRKFACDFREIQRFLLYHI